MRILWKEILSTDLRKLVPKVSIPVYFFHGIYDYTCSYTSEARSYFDQLDAPLKGFYTFYESAHSPLFEEPVKVAQVLQSDLLRGGIWNADKRPGAAMFESGRSVP